MVRLLVKRSLIFSMATYLPPVSSPSQLCLGFLKDLALLFISKSLYSKESLGEFINLLPMQIELRLSYSPGMVRYYLLCMGRVQLVNSVIVSMLVYNFHIYA